MKASLRYLCVFVLGAAAALGVASVFLPPSMIAEITEITTGQRVEWTLEDFKTINDELSTIPGVNRRIVAVIPSRHGYQIHISDERLRARFGFVNRAEDEIAIEAIRTRMEELRAENEGIPRLISE